MADLGGAVEYLGWLQDVVANFNAEGSADLPASEQPVTPPEPELPPSQVPGEPDEEPLLPDDSDYFEEDSDDDEVQARPEDEWWISNPTRFYMFKKGGGKGSDKGSHKGATKAVATVQILPASSEKASPLWPWPWFQKQQEIGEPPPRPPFPPPFPQTAFGPIPPGFAPSLAPLISFPPGMQAPTPPPGEVEPPPPSSNGGSKRKRCLVPPPPDERNQRRDLKAVLPSQTGDATTSSLWFRPTSKKMPKAMPPGGARTNWEKQYRIAKDKSEQACLAFAERWPRPNSRHEDDIFSELFQRSMIMSLPLGNSNLYKGLASVLQEYKREIVRDNFAQQLRNSRVD
jgi:hypothetical protein